MLSSCSGTCRLVLRLHSDALNAKKMFWETLLHNSVPFDTLAKTVALVDQTVSAML